MFGRVERAFCVTRLTTSTAHNTLAPLLSQPRPAQTSPAQPNHHLHHLLHQLKLDGDDANPLSKQTSSSGLERRRRLSSADGAPTPSSRCARPLPNPDTLLTAHAHAPHQPCQRRHTCHSTTPLSCSGGPNTPSSKGLIRRSSGSTDGGRGNNRPFANTTSRCRQSMIGSITSRIHTAAAVHGETFQEKESCTVRVRVRDATTRRRRDGGGV